MKIEADDLATGPAPAELLLPGRPQTYGAIISALKKGGPFVHRAIDAPPYSFFFRNREDDDSDPCYAVQYRLVAQNRT